MERFATLAGEPGVVACLFLWPVESMLTHRVIDNPWSLALEFLVRPFASGS
jgi:hypothetical protein